MLDYFALLILIVLVATAIAVVLTLGYLPGQIARGRNHPQAEAVGVCGWLGLLTAGVLLPAAYVWAFWRYPSTPAHQATTGEGQEQ
ncbi:Inner membrane protein YiaW [Posidoniimonas polymericola]|uniref:Inner membrane protein YiaW n=1 Tax=Posidoniimonas polymericola TaxID=2528002 RepID=A0A5C5YM07_9BACT|nr:DUF3302 domain-containing protein [Posidoniimonas polymericola]TWT75942.1 Inner membrane protein YiaW [Posidoniimonas polymericola]